MSEIIYTDAVLEKLDNAVQEACDSLVRTSGETDLRKEIATLMKEEIGISTSEFNALAKQRYDESSSNKIEKLEEVVELHDKLMDFRRKRKTTTTTP